MLSSLTPTLILFVLGLISLLLGQVVLTVVAFTERTRWGMLSIALPFVASLIFSLLHWRRGRAGFLMSAVGVFAMLVAAAGGGVDAMLSDRDDPQSERANLEYWFDDALDPTARPPDSEIYLEPVIQPRQAGTPQGMDAGAASTGYKLRPTAEPGAPVRVERRFKAVDPARLSQYIDHSARLTLREDVVTGRIIAVIDGGVRFERRAFGGSITHTIQRGRINKAEVLVEQVIRDPGNSSTQR